MYKSNYDEAKTLINNAKKELSRYSWFIDYEKAFNLYTEGLENYNKYLCKLNTNAIYRLSDYKECQKEMLNNYIDVINMYMKYNHKIINYHKIMIILTNYLQLCNNMCINCNDNIEKFLNKEKFLPESISTHEFTLLDKEKIYGLLAENYVIRKNYYKAIEYYEKILMYLTLAGDYYMKNAEILKKIIEVNIITGDYNKASKHYKEIARLSSLKRLTNFNTSLYLIQSIIIIMDIKTDDEIKEIIDEYNNLYSQFTNTGDYILLNDILQAYKNKDISQLQTINKQCCFKFDPVVINKIDNIIKYINNYK